MIAPWEILFYRRDSDRHDGLREVGSRLCWSAGCGVEAGARGNSGGHEP
jgi:hypothetical protein